MRYSVGLDIQTHVVRAVALLSGKKTPSAFAEAFIDSNIDTLDEVLPHVISDVWKKLSIRQRCVRIALPDHQVMRTYFQCDTTVSKIDLIKTAHQQCQQLSPFADTPLHWMWWRTNDTVLCIATKPSLIAERCRLVRAAGLFATVIDVEHFAWMRALAIKNTRGVLVSIANDIQVRVFSETRWLLTHVVNLSRVDEVSLWQVIQQALHLSALSSIEHLYLCGASVQVDWIKFLQPRVLKPIRWIKDVHDLPLLYAVSYGLARHAG